MKDVTLGQIVDLYQKFLRNDNIEADHSLNIVLGVRPNFSTRLANLSASAAEGKGLSEVISWHVESESAEDAVELSQHENTQALESDIPQQQGRTEAPHDEGGNGKTNAAQTSEHGSHQEESQPSIKTVKIETASQGIRDENSRAEGSNEGDEQSEIARSPSTNQKHKQDDSLEFEGKGEAEANDKDTSSVLEAINGNEVHNGMFRYIFPAYCGLLAKPILTVLCFSRRG